ncbi:hypothetical protein [Arthrobacter ramosus]|uniref:Uncharacterized protein n=1 Tax=Arthrobacter ramosus TaxID=1672 RepID=A0ABV5Y461_ARTRM|nr:hypothetical protein [Arthrobacter ramosus]
MTRRKVPVALVALPFALCLIALAPAETAGAASCDSQGLLGVVGMCSPGSSPSPRPTGKATPSTTASPPVQPQPQPDPGVAVPPGGASTTAPAVTAEPAPTQVAPPATITAAVPSPIVSNPSPSTQNSASAAAARIDPGAPAQSDHPIAPTVSVAGILVAFGGTLIAAGGVVGLRRFPPL